MGGDDHCRGGQRRVGRAVEGNPGPGGSPLAGAANHPSPSRHAAEPLGAVARFRRSATGHAAAGAASHAPLLPCPGHGPHAISRPGGPHHAAAGARTAAFGHRPAALGHRDHPVRHIFRLGRQLALGPGQRGAGLVSLLCHRRAGLHPCRAARDGLLPGPAADAAGSGRRSRLDAGNRQNRLPAAARGDRVAAAGRHRPGQRAALCGDGREPCPPRARYGRDRGRLSAAAGGDRGRAGRSVPPGRRQIPASAPRAGGPLHGLLGRAPRAIRTDARRQQGPARERMERNGRALDERAGEIRRGDGNDPRKLRTIVSRIGTRRTPAPGRRPKRRPSPSASARSTCS